MQFRCLFLFTLLYTIQAQTITRYRDLTLPENAEVVLWGITEMHHHNQDVCWKDQYGNGFGEPRICSSGYVQEGAMCYKRCNDGYEAISGGLVCRKKCGPGFSSDDGAFCRKPKPYGRGIGRSCLKRWKCSCRADEDKRGLMCYPKCRAGFHAVGCCVCSPNCPSGFTDIGISCKRPGYARDVKLRTDCPQGLVKKPNGLRCFEPCRDGFAGIGPICRQVCPPGQPFNCGLLCAKDRASCGLAVFDMILAPIAMVANLFTLGAASKVKAASKLLTETGRLTLETAQKLAPLFKAGNSVLRGAALAEQAVQTIMDAINPGVEQTLKPRFVAAYGEVNAALLTFECTVAVVFMIIKVSLMELGFTVASFADPTGIVGTIQAFAQPKCRNPTVPPSFANLITTFAVRGVTLAPTSAPPTFASLLPPVATDITVNITQSSNSFLSERVCASGATPLKCSTLVNPTIAQTCTPTTCNAAEALVCVQQECAACNTTCVFDKTLCLTNPCDDPEVQADCQPGTCTPDFSESCDFKCTPKTVASRVPVCSPPVNGVAPLCAVGDPAWSTTTCAFSCPNVCPDGSAARFCPTTASCDGWSPAQRASCVAPARCVTDYCSNTTTTCQTSCQFDPELCQEEPCLTQKAQEECETDTCQNDYSSGCNYQCIAKARSALTTTLNFVMMWKGTNNEALATRKRMLTQQTSTPAPYTVQQVPIEGGALRCVSALHLVAAASDLLSGTGTLFTNSLIDARSIKLINPTTGAWNVTIAFSGNTVEERYEAIQAFFQAINTSTDTATETDTKPQVVKVNVPATATTAASIFLVNESSLLTSEALIDQHTCDNGSHISAFTRCQTPSPILGCLLNDGVTRVTIGTSFFVQCNRCTCINNNVANGCTLQACVRGDYDNQGQILVLYSTFQITWRTLARVSPRLLTASYIRPRIIERMKAIAKAANILSALVVNQAQIKLISGGQTQTQKWTVQLGFVPSSSVPSVSARDRFLAELITQRDLAAANINNVNANQEQVEVDEDTRVDTQQAQALKECDDGSSTAEEICPTEEPDVPTDGNISAAAPLPCSVAVMLGLAVGAGAAVIHQA